MSKTLQLCSSLQVIPPGMEFHHIVPLDGDMDGETDTSEDHHPTPADPPIWTEVLFILFTSTVVVPRKIADK